MNEPTDPKIAFVHMVKDHMNYKPVQEISKILLSDEYGGFWLDSFHSGRWCCRGGLAEATVLGYRTMRFMTIMLKQVQGEVPDLDRIVALYLCWMTGNWLDLRTMYSPGLLVGQTAVANAVAIGMDIRPKEVEALVHWINNTDFGSEHWLLTQTISWLLTASQK